MGAAGDEAACSLNGRMSSEETDQNLRGTIFDIKRFALHDGPGIRTTVFLKGCPLSCPWCHNPESISPEPQLSFIRSRCTACGACVEACPHGAVRLDGDASVTDRAICIACGACVDACPTGAREIIGRQVTARQAAEHAVLDRVFYEESGGGVTFSGGEPLAQPQFLAAALEMCKERNLDTDVDTSCCVPWESIEAARPFTDLFLCDLKHPDSARHEEVTGAPNELILENIGRLSESGERILIRIPLIPGFNTDPDTIEASGRFIASLPDVERVDLLNYNKLSAGKLDRLGMTSDWSPGAEETDRLSERAAGILERFGLTVHR